MKQITENRIKMASEAWEDFYYIFYRLSSKYYSDIRHEKKISNSMKNLNKNFTETSLFANFLSTELIGGIPYLELTEDALAFWAILPELKGAKL